MSNQPIQKYNSTCQRAYGSIDARHHPGTTKCPIWGGRQGRQGQIVVLSCPSPYPILS